MEEPRRKSKYVSCCHRITRDSEDFFFQEYRVLCYKSEKQIDGQDEEVVESFSKLQVSED
jgi:hypothetical protein